MTKYIFFLLSIILSFTSCNRDSINPVVFEIKIENISPTPSFTAQNGNRIINVFSAVFAAIHLNPQFLYTLDDNDYGLGLQNLAENADVSKLLQSYRAVNDVEVIGVADEPSTGSLGILAPNQSFTLLLSAVSKSARLSLATSFLQGNDILVMTPDQGIPLFDENLEPLNGDITSLFQFYDLGTEVNEAPGIGPNQVIRQTGDAPLGQVSPGIPERESIVELNRVNDGFSYPELESSIRVTIRVREFGNN
jgi:hypothetical protein